MVPSSVRVEPEWVTVIPDAILIVSPVLTFKVPATVALSVCTVQVPFPPPAPLKVRSLKLELPASTVLPESVASSVTVPELAVRVPLLS